MYIALSILLVLWVLSRITDAICCTILAVAFKRINNKSFADSYKMFIALAVDSFVTAIIIILVMPYLILGWSAPSAWILPWIGCAAISSTSFKTYTKFKIALRNINNKGH